MRTTLAWLVAVLLCVAACAGGEQDDEQAASHPASTTASGVASASAEPAALAVYQSAGTVWVRTADGRLVDAGSGLDGTPEHPDWSPDGQRLVVETDFSEIWALGDDGSHARRLYACQGACSYIEMPAWSPDGREIAFVEAQTKDGVTT